MVNRDRNVFAASMVTHGDADAMVTGLTRNYHGARCDHQGHRRGPRRKGNGHDHAGVPGPDGLRGRYGDHRKPDRRGTSQNRHADRQSSASAWFEPRVAMCSFSNFGNPLPEHAQVVKNAVTILDRNIPDFEYDGEMSPAVALDEALMRSAYPFCRLSGPANVLVMPGLNSANISTTLMERLGGSAVIGPLLVGLAKPAQIVRMGVNVSDMANVAALAAHDAIRRE